MSKTNHYNILTNSFTNKYLFARLFGMRYTKKQFEAEFPNDDACLEAVFQDRFGRMKCCPSCGVVKAKFYRVKDRQCYTCEWCAYQLFPLADTIFRKTQVPLKDWFYVIYQFSVHKNGVAAKTIERELGVTYKTAWRICRLVRSLMGQGSFQLSGEVESDETYIGGRRKMKQKFDNKSIVFGTVERGGMAKAKHVQSSGARVLLKEISIDVLKNSHIYTDEWRAYKSLPKQGYSHTTVNHSRLEYVQGTAHTNTIEGFWSQLKRSLDGTYHAVSPKYLQSYIDEFVFRYNYRGVAVGPVLLEKALRLS